MGGGEQQGLLGAGRARKEQEEEPHFESRGSTEVTSRGWELTRLPKGQNRLAQPWDPSLLAMFLTVIFHLSLKVLPLEEEGGVHIPVSGGEDTDRQDSLS